MIIIHHSDSYCQPIVKDMIDIHNGCMAGECCRQNDIPAIQKETEGKLILMGGLDASIMDLKDYKEDVIRGEVARACREYAPGGSFIPCLTYGGRREVSSRASMTSSWMRSAIRTRSILNKFRGSGKFQDFIGKHQIQTGVLPPPGGCPSAF